MNREFRIEYRSRPNGVWEPVSQKGWEGASRDVLKDECERLSHNDPAFEFRLATRICTDWMFS